LWIIDVDLDLNLNLNLNLNANLDLDVNTSMGFRRGEDHDPGGACVVRTNTGC